MSISGRDKAQSSRAKVTISLLLSQHKKCAKTLYPYPNIQVRAFKWTLKGSTDWINYLSKCFCSLLAQLLPSLPLQTLFEFHHRRAFYLCTTCAIDPETTNHYDILINNLLVIQISEKSNINKVSIAVWLPLIFTYIFISFILLILKFSFYLLANSPSFFVRLLIPLEIFI